MNSNKRKVVLAIGLSLVAASCAMEGQQGGGNPMSYFVTSAGPGKGADLGGIAGADRLCQSLAQSVGAGSKTWRAYLSTSGAGAVNARDRIGGGPWQNAKGVMVARDVNDLHSAGNNLTKQTSLSEKGEVISGRGDPVNMHDALTGSSPDGRALPGDMTCNNWTNGGAGTAMLGHIDRIGLTEDPPAKSWNSSHPSKGCSQDNLKATGGAGLIYCFATN